MMFRSQKSVESLSRHIHLPEDVAESDLVRTVRELNGDPAVHGILVQLPLPHHIREEAVIDAIAPAKDVDGFTPENIGRMVIGRECFLPCTPHGIVQLLVEAGIETAGRHAVVVGTTLGGVGAAYSYDAAGNRTAIDWEGAASAYTANGLNQYVSVVSGGATNALAYDTWGNLTDTSPFRFTYSYAGNLLVGVDTNRVNGVRAYADYDLRGIQGV